MRCLSGLMVWSALQQVYREPALAGSESTILRRAAAEKLVCEAGERAEASDHHALAEEEEAREVVDGELVGDSRPSDSDSAQEAILVEALFAGPREQEEPRRPEQPVQPVEQEDEEEEEEQLVLRVVVVAAAGLVGDRKAGRRCRRSLLFR